MSGIWYNYVYDGFGRLKEVKINGETAVTVSETKDDDGVRTLVQTLADGTEYTVTSDAQGRTAEVKLGSEVIKNGFEYDDAGRCTGYIEFPGGANKKQHKFTYKDTETSHVSGDVTVTSLNDKKGKTTSTTYRFSESDAHVYNFAYENDFDEKLKSITHGNVVQTITHDKLGRQTESKIEGIYSKKATYLKYGDHTTDMISDLTYRIANGNTDREKYSYDKEGNICAIHENGRLKVKYTYDALNRLIREDNKELELTTTFEYDNGGNIIRQNEYAYSLADTDQLTDGTEIVYTYDGDRSDKLTDFNGESISYDENGCPITYRDNACTYTRGTLLKTYGSNNFEYDADGIRTKKNGITFTYVDGKLIRQTGGSGTIDFIYGAGGAIGFKYAGNTYIYRRNLMGDVTYIYDTNGALKAKYVYDAWGNHKITTDVNGIGTLNPIRYRGYYYDTETGLYYLEARYYDPEAGRFISQDSIDFIVPNHLTGLNLYAYCNNNPVMNVDPSGNFWKELYDGVNNVLGLLNPVNKLTAIVSVATAMFQGRWSDLATDWQNGCFNPFNWDEQIAVNSKVFSFYKGASVVRHSWGGSLQLFGTIFMDSSETIDNNGIQTLNHEWGHSVQEMVLGPTYITRIAIPSVAYYWYDKKAGGSNIDYYSMPWERTADWLGGINGSYGYKKGSLAWAIAENLLGPIVIPLYFWFGY